MSNDTVCSRAEMVAAELVVFVAVESMIIEVLMAVLVLAILAGMKGTSGTKNGSDLVLGEMCSSGTKKGSEFELSGTKNGSDVFRKLQRLRLLLSFACLV